MRVRARHAASLVILLAIVVTAASVWAGDPCSGVPECRQETQSTLKLKGLQSKGWAYYCVNGYPYYYNWSKSGYGGISVTENPFAEGSNVSKFDATITNWDPLKTQSVTITLGCSKIPKGSSCKSISSDPKCPTIRGPDNNCSSGPVPVCVQTWTEKCSNGNEWNCTDDEGVIWCSC